MTAFKFACPSCRQHVETPVGASGQHVECPSCKTRIIIPAPPLVDGLVPIAGWENPPPQPPHAEPQPETKAKTNEPPPKTASNAQPATSEADTDSPFPAMPEEPPKVPRVPQAEARVAVLTPQLKLDIVRTVRSLIADNSHWMPGKTGSTEYSYAAKQDDGKLVPVPYASVEATHFSIFGALMLEFHRRNVVNTARGRREFLDEELIEAIREVLAREPATVPLEERDRPPLTHEQCLAVLDLLEERYSDAAAKTKAESVERHLERISIEDLVRKLEKKAPIKSDQVATALYHELEAIKARLAALEKDSPKRR